MAAVPLAVVVETVAFAGVHSRLRSTFGSNFAKHCDKFSIVQLGAADAVGVYGRRD